MDFDAPSAAESNVWANPSGTAKQVEASSDLTKIALSIH